METIVSRRMMTSSPGAVVVVQTVPITTNVVSSNPIYGDTTFCDKVCQWLVTGWRFSLVPPVSSTNKTDHLDITEILLKVVLNTINHHNQQPTIIAPYHYTITKYLQSYKKITQFIWFLKYSHYNEGKVKW